MVHHSSNSLVHDAFWRALAEFLRDELEVILEKIDPADRWSGKLVLGEYLRHSARRSGQHLGFGDEKWPVEIENFLDEARRPEGTYAELHRRDP